MAEGRQEPDNQAQLLEVIAASWNPCVTLIDALIDHQWTGATDGHGWTIKDHVAHVTAWENVVIEVFRTGSPPYATLRMPEADWLATGIEGADALIHIQKTGQSLRRVKVNRDVTHARVVTIISELTEDELRRPFSDFGAVGANRTVLAEMMDYLVNRYDTLCASIKTIIQA